MASMGSKSLGPDIKVKPYEYKPPPKSTYADAMSNGHRKPNNTTQPPPKPKPSPKTPPITRKPREVKKDPSTSSYVEYKPKPYNHKYREYKPTYETPKYKPYVPTQLQFKGNVEYKLTKENYYPMNHWKSRSLDKEVPVVPPKAVTPPPPPKTPTPTPPPPKSPTPPPPKSPTPEPIRQPSPKLLPAIYATKRKSTPPPLPALSPLPPVRRLPPPTQRYYLETMYPPEVIACVKAYLMANRHAPYKQYRLPYWIVKEYF